MGLQYQLDTLDGVDESVAAFYTQSEDGKFTLGVEGLPKQEPQEDVSGLKKKVQELLDEKKEAQRKEAEAAEAAKKAAEEAARKSGDTEALEKSWSEKLSNREKELMQEINSRDAVITSKFVDAEAIKIANELAVDGSADVLLPHVKNRIKVERTESGDYRTVVLDAEGKPSAKSLTELRDEFDNMSAFAPILKGNKANGSGAPGGSGNSGARPTQNDAAEKAKQAKDLNGYLAASLSQSNL